MGRVRTCSLWNSAQQPIYLYSLCVVYLQHRENILIFRRHACLRWLKSSVSPECSHKYLVLGYSEVVEF